MKVLIGLFSTESNSHSHSLMSFDKFIFRYGDDLIEHMHVKDIFDKAGIELIPSIYASGHPHGPVTPDAFEFIRSRFVQDVKEHIDEIDGIYLFLHGASQVIGLEGTSGEHEIIRSIRKITGPYLPIAVCMDPHGNLSQELADQVQILRCYRQSPHTDTVETYRIVADKLVWLLQDRHNIHPVYRRVPIIIGGEKSVSTDEPVLSINHLCDEAEKEEGILSASFHIGYLRHDDDKLGCGVIVIPKTEKDVHLAEQWADRIRAYAYSQRHAFHYHGNTAEPQEALDQVLASKSPLCVITDSGDNVGSGADGFNTYILRQVLAVKDLKKRFLFAAIVDQEARLYLQSHAVGEHVSFSLGKNLDALCQSVKLNGTIVAKGLGSDRYKEKTDYGTVISVKLDDAPVTVMVEYDAIQFLSPEQIVLAGLQMSDYDVIVVKQGYISPEFDAVAPLCVMSLTDGPTNQRSERIVFHKIQRPMYPYDDLALEEIDGTVPSGK